MMFGRKKKMEKEAAVLAGGGDAHRSAGQADETAELFRLIPPAGSLARDFRLPLVLRLPHRTIDLQQYLEGAVEAVADLEDLAPRRGELIWGSAVVAECLMEKGKKGSPAVKITRPLLDVRESEKTSFVLDRPVTLTAELTRKVLEYSECLSLRDGSIILFDKLVTAPVDMLLDEKRVVARGEVCQLEDRFAVRITEIVSSSVRVPAVPVGAVPRMTARLVLGRTVLTVRDLLGLGKGSVYALSRFSNEPVDLEFDNGLVLKGEVVVVDESLGVRIVMREGNDIPGEAEDDKAERKSVGGEWEDRLDSLKNTLKEELDMLRMELSAHIRDEALEEDFASVVERGETSGNGAGGGGLPPERDLNSMDPEILYGLLAGENPQITALVLTRLDVDRASFLLAAFPEETQRDLIRRISLMNRVSPEVIKAVESVISRKVRDLSPSETSGSGGIGFAADMLARMDRGWQARLLESLEETDPELGRALKSDIFLFEDLVLLDDRSVQKVLREVDTQDLAISLKGTSAEVMEKIFRNMSKRAAALLREDMDFMGPVRLRDVEQRQEKIINIIKKLVECGDIIIARSGEDELVV